MKILLHTKEHKCCSLPWSYSTLELYRGGGGGAEAADYRVEEMFSKKKKIVSLDLPRWYTSMHLRPLLPLSRIHPPRAHELTLLPSKWLTRLWLTSMGIVSVWIEKMTSCRICPSCMCLAHMCPSTCPSNHNWMFTASVSVGLPLRATASRNLFVELPARSHCHNDLTFLSTNSNSNPRGHLEPAPRTLYLEPPRAPVLEPYQSPPIEPHDLAMAHPPRIISSSSRWPICLKSSIQV